MDKIKTGVFLGVLILVGVGIYDQLGGFNEVKLAMEDCGEINLLGLTYRGTPQDEKMGETFRKIGKIVENHSGSSLHTVYTIEPAGKRDTLQVFVGTEFSAHVSPSKELEVQTIPCSRAIVAYIQAHSLVMPSPEKVKRKIKAFAQDKGVAIQGIYVDKIKGKDQVEVIAPLK